MSEGREPAPTPSPSEPRAEPPRRVHVGPEDVFQPGQGPRGRWREHSFFAPILLVVLISTALVYGGIVAAGVAWRLLH